MTPDDDDEFDEQERAERERYAREQIERKEREERHRVEYLGLPALKRLERWGETLNWPIGFSMGELARALHDWAVEEQKKKTD